MVIGTKCCLLSLHRFSWEPCLASFYIVLQAKLRLLFCCLISQICLALSRCKVTSFGLIAHITHILIIRRNWNKSKVKSPYCLFCTFNKRTFLWKSNMLGEGTRHWLLLLYLRTFFLLVRTNTRLTHLILQHSSFLGHRVKRYMAFGGCRNGADLMLLSLYTEQHH